MMQNRAHHNPFPLGVRPLNEYSRKGIFAAMETTSGGKEECGILLFDKKSGECLKKHTFPECNRMGSVRFDSIPGVEHGKISWLFFEGEHVFADKYGKAYQVSGGYGVLKAADDYRAILPDMDFDWENTSCPRIPYEDSILYCLHVRGFTKHITSGVKGKGTFAGVKEKLPYLKSLGVTALELQPAYEFDEAVPFDSGKKKRTGVKAYGLDRENPGHAEELLKTAHIKNEAETVSDIFSLNYWGYREGCYYAPKRHYAYGKDPVREFKELVKACHRNGMELIMQFYFPKEVPVALVSDVLRYWTWQYQVDGFHLLGDAVLPGELAADPYLKDVKLLCCEFPVYSLYPDSKAPIHRNLAVYEDSFLYTLRSFLKGDGGVLQEAVERMRRNPKYTGVINYFANYNTFTMMDMVSYNEKHNEVNGENNRDGAEYNGSWNCGHEGRTKKPQVLELRRKLYRNAAAMLMLSQGTPLLFMGDEFGNSQQGNNNPYGQDNNITWLNWNDLKRNQELYAFMKQMIQLRQAHRVFHQHRECLLMDYQSCGYPDLSYHNEQAWKPGFDRESRHVAYMLCGRYAEGCEDSFWYMAMNMHWEEHDFAMPKLPKGMKWEKFLITGEAAAEKTAAIEESTSVEMVSEESAGARNESGNPSSGKKVSGKNSRKDEPRKMERVAPRSIAIFKAEK